MTGRARTEGEGGGTRDCLERGWRRHLDSVQLLRGELLERLEGLVGRVEETLHAGGKILTCGNGGSACDAQHLASELVGRYKEERRPLAAIALNSDGSILTCLSNDYDYARVFARQIEALARPGDLLLAFTTSGRSPNVLEALRAARTLGVGTAAFLGRDGGPARDLTELAIVVPSDETARIQECHGLMIHLLCEALDLRLRGHAAP